MQIINPLYDKAFKYLMQNNRLAKKVLSVILDQTVDKLQLSQQETVVPDEKRNLTLFRLDFKADILTAEGKKQTVLIELQKSKFSTDIKRFRNYLGANYMNSIATSGDEEKKETSIYPIITIYILGYKLKDLPFMAVTVNRQIVNSVNKEKLNVDSFFINHLTHRSHVIQVRRLPNERKSKLEKFLTLFNQAWCTNKKYIIDLPDIPKDFLDIAKHLQKPVLDPKFQRQLEAEEEIDFIFDEQESKYLAKIEQAEKEKEKAEMDKEKAEMDKEKADMQKEKAELKMEVTILYFKDKKSISDIAKLTNQSTEFIEKVIGL